MEAITVGKAERWGLGGAGGSWDGEVGGALSAQLRGPNSGDGIQGEQRFGVQGWHTELQAGNRDGLWSPLVTKTP